MHGGDTCRTESILDSFKFKRLEKIRTQEPLECDEVKIVDLSDMPPLEVDEVEILDLPDMSPLEGD